MNIDKLERANILAKILIPKIDSFLDISSNSNIRLIDTIRTLSQYDREFETKFKQLLHETRQRLQKELDELSN